MVNHKKQNMESKPTKEELSAELAITYAAVLVVCYAMNRSDKIETDIRKARKAISRLDKLLEIIQRLEK